MNQVITLGELMAMLKEAEPELSKGQEVQGASYFDIPEGQGLVEGFWGMK